MSFLTGTNQGTTPTDTTNTEPKPEDYVSKIVQEQGEQWQDPQAIAKGYLNAQEYIKELERQTSELREDLGKKDYAEKLLKELQGTQAPNSGEAPQVSTQNTGDTGTANTTPNASEQDLKSLIEETLTQREVENTARQNLEAAEAKLAELYGTESDKVLEQRMNELGMSKDAFTSIAAQSPTAFLKLIGEATKEQASPVKTGTVNTAAGFQTQSPDTRNWNYYKKLRQENSKEYYTPRVQNQMVQDREKMGENFFN